MSWLKDLVVETAEEVFRTEAERIVRKVARPVHAVVSDLSGEAARRAARTVHQGLDRLAGEAARRTASALARKLARGGTGRKSR